LHYTQDWRKLVRFRSNPAEQRALSVLRKAARAWRSHPKYLALRTASELRRYFAEKSEAIHRASLGDRRLLQSLAPCLQETLRLSRALWRRYRHPGDANPIEKILIEDRKTLRKHLANPNELRPAAILQIEVENCRPAMQGFTVEI